MNEIKNMEQLRTEKARLKLELEENEQEIHNEIDYFNKHMQPIFNLVDFSKSKISPLIGGIAKLALPLIVGKMAKTTAKAGTKASIWGMAATLAAEYLVKNVDFASVGNKVTGFFSCRKHKPCNTVDVD
jgi:hypothetical protein